MSNIIVMIIIGLVLCFAGYIVFKMLELQKNEVLLVSDEIVKAIVNSGGTVSKMHRVNTKGTIEFFVTYQDSLGNEQEREVLKRLNNQGKSTGSLFWNQPLISNQPNTDIEIKHLKSSQL